jgi:hypothetical protein
VPDPEKRRGREEMVRREEGREEAREEGGDTS